jgi:hypothetical protein
MSEFIKWLWKLIVKKLRLDRWASKFASKIFEFLADHFSHLARRWLIVLLFVTFLFMSGPWRDEWKNFQNKYFSLGQNSETNLVSGTLPVVQMNGATAGLTNKTFNMIVTNGFPILMHSNNATYVMTLQGPVLALPASPTKTQAGVFFEGTRK